jgi:hypothetical protein
VRGSTPRGPTNFLVSTVNSSATSEVLSYFLREAESSYGSDLLNLVVAKGYLTKLLANEAVKSYIARHEPEILGHLELVVNTVSMEEAVQQQLNAELDDFPPR